jgi:diguanylate cyclase (GGDEF)-like protein
VNDTFGHQAGDLVLQQMSDILRASVRETDRVVRWGGEEFLVVARDTQAEEVSQLAERIRMGVASHDFHLVDHPPIHKTCSIGFACFPVLLRDPGLFSWEQVVDLADQCLYKAKNEGRNRWVGILPREDATSDLSLNPRELNADRLTELGLVSQHTSHPPGA